MCAGITYVCKFNLLGSLVWIEKAPVILNQMEVLGNS